MFCIIDLLRPVGCLHLHGAGTLQPAKPADNRHIILLKQVLHPLAHHIGHPPAAGYHCPEIRRRRLSGINAVVGSMPGIFKYLRTLQQRLGGYTAPVKAYPARLRLLH